MAHATLTEETFVVSPSDPLWDQLSKMKGILGVMGALNCAGSLPIESEDLGCTLRTLSEILDVVEKDLDKIDTQWEVLREFYLAHHPSLAAHPTKDPAKVNGHPKGKAKVSKGGSRNGHPT